MAQVLAAAPQPAGVGVVALYAAGDHGADHHRDHERWHDGVVTGHLENEQDGGDWCAGGRGHDGPQTNERVRFGRDRQRRQERAQRHPHGAAHRGTDEQRWGE